MLTLTSLSATHNYEWPTSPARHLIDELSRVRRPTFLGDRVDFGDIKLECTDLSRVLHYVFDETEVDVPPQVLDAIQLLEYRAPRKKKRRNVSKDVLVRKRKEKVKAGAYTTINTIAQQVGRSPRDCRQALRKLGVPKPEHGWSWPPSEAAVITSKLARRFGKKVARQTPLSKDEGLTPTCDNIDTVSSSLN